MDPQPIVKVFHVLAGAYVGKDPPLSSTLAHAAEVDREGWPTRVLCGRVRLESLAEVDRDEAVTCPRCLVALARRGVRTVVTESGARTLARVP